MKISQAKTEIEALREEIRYHERKYGSTNIQRWKHGWLLFKMLLIAARRLKFI